MAMRERPSSRLIILAPDGSALLFYFRLSALAGEKREFWATPGGGLKAGESYADAARRELLEETGFDLDVGEEVSQGTAEFPLPDGTMVRADERFFAVRVNHKRIDGSRHSPHERKAMTSHRWWSAPELRSTRETVFPDNFATLVAEQLGMNDLNGRTRPFEMG